MSLTKFDILCECRHFFVRETRSGSFSVNADGQLLPDGLPAHAVVIYIPENEPLRVLETDSSGCLTCTVRGTLQGTLHICLPPEPLRLLCEQIIAWDARHPADGLLQEKYESYSATRAPGYSWRTVFAPQLHPWRRMFPEVSI